MLKPLQPTRTADGAPAKIGTRRAVYEDLKKVDGCLRVARRRRVIDDIRKLMGL